jgi:hypothetical protein
VPAGAAINSAALNMMFLNWQVGITSTVQVSSSTPHNKTLRIS